MNKTLESFARDQIKVGLAQLTEQNHHIFKWMYSPRDLTKPINDVVDEMPATQLNWALEQVERSLEKNRCLKTVKHDEN